MNCPNCAAPITGPKCEYCGTVFTPPKVTHTPEVTRTGPIDIYTKIWTTHLHMKYGLSTPNEIRKDFGLKGI